jgi:thiamine-monophosphate kinase
MSVSEFDLIARYFTRPAKTVALGVGDDCALLKPPEGLGLAITTDMLCEGTHFFADVDPRSLGHKALAVNISDIAAMGAEPRWATLAIALPRVDESWLAAFTAGLFALADRFGVELIGGDTTRGPLAMNITLIGTYPLGHALRRDGALAGDDLWVSGHTGEAALMVEHRRGRATLTGDALARCAERLDWPEPRVALGRALRQIANGAIDVSDGLIADIGRICERSHLGAEIELALVPQADVLRAWPDRAVALRCLLASGDDYELAFTAPSSARERIGAIGVQLGLPLTRIGRMVSGQSTVRVLDEDGVPIELGATGFDHFR